MLLQSDAWRVRGGEGALPIAAVVSLLERDAGDATDGTAATC